MPIQEWTPLHQQYAELLDSSLESIEEIVRRPTKKTLEEAADSYLMNLALYTHLSKALNKHDCFVLGRRIARVYMAVYGGLYLFGSDFV